MDINTGPLESLAPVRLGLKVQRHGAFRALGWIRAIFLGLLVSVKTTSVGQ